MEELLHEDEIPVGRAKDLRGQVFGRWTVLYRTKSTNKQVAWMCQCECGTIRKVQSNHLTSGKTSSCGCYNNELCAQLGRDCANDLTGQRFGRLIAIKPTERRSGSFVVWECLCDCGATHYVSSGHLKSGNVQSCGCYHKDKMRELLALDLTNQKFGKLTALKSTGRKRGSFLEWECLCECGNICYIASAALTSRHTTSCGCSKSKGELTIIRLLENAQIPYITQKTFENCCFTNGNLLKFDFYINNLYLIEFDGIQHFEPVEHFGGKEQFLIQTRRDRYKNQWCKENNIPLIRIPYTKLDTLCIEDLMLETTQFRVV